MVLTLFYQMVYEASLNFPPISSSLIFQATCNCIFVLHYNLTKMRLFETKNYLFFFDSNQNPHSGALNASKLIQNKIFGICHAYKFISNIFPFPEYGENRFLRNVNNSLPCMINSSLLCNKADMQYTRK
jgi:hypothetical protein